MDRPSRQAETPQPDAAIPAVDAASPRQAVDRLIATGDVERARLALGQLWREAPGGAVASFVVSRFEKIAPAIDLQPVKLAILRSFTIEPAVPLLRAMAFVGGIRLDVLLGDFNTYAQEILDADSSLYKFSPQATILAVDGADVAPALWEGFADLDGAGALAIVERAAGELARLVTLFRSRSTSHLIVHALQTPAPAAGLLDSRVQPSQRAAFAAINARLAALANEVDNVYLLDYDALIARRGAIAWRDERKWLTARMPIAAAELGQLAREWMRFLHPIAGKVCKAVAVDLDNTLWGGVIGEDGLEGIRLGVEWPGAAFRQTQRALLDLYRRGVLLAICSKNNLDEAREAIERHPGMLLRMEHFSAVRANWNDKAENLREIAAELNIGLDALAFLDDNPVERDWARRQLPEVTVLEPPADPLLFAQALRDCPLFERLSLSAEDRERGRHYAEQRRRTELRESGGSLEDFYRSLAMTVEIAPLARETLARAAQLTQKTNQFNLTTRRYSEARLAELAAMPGWRIDTVRVRDRFGDAGIVGLAMCRDEHGVREIDNFLLSCRVIGRTIETAMLAAIAADAAAAGLLAVRGRYIPTKKNSPAENRFRLHGFVAEVDEAAASASDASAEMSPAVVWRLALPAPGLAAPPWITLRVAGERVSIQSVGEA